MRTASLALPQRGARPAAIGEGGGTRPNPATLLTAAAPPGARAVGVRSGACGLVQVLVVQVLDLALRRRELGGQQVVDHAEDAGADHEGRGGAHARGDGPAPLQEPRGAGAPGGVGGRRAAGPRVRAVARAEPRHEDPEGGAVGLRGR